MTNNAIHITHKHKLKISEYKMNTEYEKGTKLIVELTSGETYEGIFSFGDSLMMRLTNVSEYPFGAKEDMLLNFYKTEIKSVSIIEEKANQEQNDSLTSADSNSTSIVLIKEQEYEKLKKLSQDYIYIAVVDSRFYSAIEILKSTVQIAVFGLGSSFGRNSKISLLTVATNQQVYIFDIKLSGQRAFEMGLKDILQSRSILKIVHDSKILADCLLHAHEVSLENVFDTQIADLLIVRKNSQELPEKVRKFSVCINHYLNIPTSVIENSEIGLKQLLERPLTDELKMNAALQVTYLYALKDFLNNQMLQTFNLAVNCYMRSMRNEEHCIAYNMINNDVPTVLKELNPKL